MDPWATVEDARSSTWREAGDIPAETLADLLLAATEGCADYAPSLADGDPLPFRYTLAAIYQARELWAAGMRDGDVIASEAGVIRARDLTSTVRALLRPPRGLPGVG